MRSVYRQVSQRDDDATPESRVFDLSDFQDVVPAPEPDPDPNRPARLSTARPLLTSTGTSDSCEYFDPFLADMDERDSIYLDAVSIGSDGTAAAAANGTNRKSLYLSRQTVYHSAEELPTGGDGTLGRTRATTESMLNDLRANGGLPNLPYEGRPANGSGGGGILKRPGLTTQYRPEVDPDDDEEEESLLTQSTTTTTNTNHDLYHHHRKHEPRPIVTYSLWKTRTWNRFQDGKRVVDFVLAFNGHLQNDGEADRKRKIFQENLVREGLEIEPETTQRIHFIKIHVPPEVVSRYCEHMKMKMPIVKLKDQEQVFTREFSFGGSLVKFFRRPMFRFVIIDRDKFRKREYRLLHEYSREKCYLFDSDQAEFFTPSIRIAVAHFILERARFGLEDEKYDIGLRKLLNDQVYLDAYPLHDGSPDLPELECQRTLLLEEWASVIRWIKHQPLDHIKEYFGVKIAMYFAWLGFYTHMLISASIVGLLCFFYGLLTFQDNRISQEICRANETIMCPTCDAKCDYWRLSDACAYSHISHIFDNNFTIVFAVFMSIWATLYLELWKRYSSDIQHRWGVTDYCLLAEPPRPQYLARLKDSKKTFFNIVTGAQEPSPPFWTKKLPSMLYSYSIISLFIVLALSAVFGIVIYRMSLMTTRNIYGNPDDATTKLLLFSGTTAVINLMVSTVLNYAYDYVAVYMTDIEYRRTQSEYNESLNLKIYLFQFINYYSSIFYIAFIKGKFPGYPAKYNRILSFRQEECSQGGCLVELCIQLAIIMVGKQVIALILEIMLPFCWQKLKEFRSVLGLATEDSENKGPGGEQLICCNQWTKDFNLLSWHDRSLFEEYLKMIIQYGFITIFVVAFPLGPLFALLNNVFETRLDAKKFLLYYKRSVPRRVRDIGIWYNVMHVLGKIAVISSAFIIAFSSDFIPRLYYKYLLNKDRTEDGFVEHTLAVFNVNDFEDGAAPIRSIFVNVTQCRYPEYRNPPDDPQAPYKRPLFYWHMLALRLAFVVIYQNVVSFIQIVVAWAIPDVPGRLQDQIKREQYLMNEFIIKQEKRLTDRRKGCVGGRNGTLTRQQSSLDDYGTASLLEEDEATIRVEEEKFGMAPRRRIASSGGPGGGQTTAEINERFKECEIVTSRV